MEKRLDKGLLELSEIAAKGRNRFQTELVKVYGVGDSLIIKLLDLSRQTRFYAEQGDKELQEKAMNDAAQSILEMKEQAQTLKESTEKMNALLEKRIEEIELTLLEVKLSVKK